MADYDFEDIFCEMEAYYPDIIVSIFFPFILLLNILSIAALAKKYRRQTKSVKTDHEIQLHFIHLMVKFVPN